MQSARQAIADPAAADLILPASQGNHPTVRAADAPVHGGFQILSGYTDLQPAGWVAVTVHPSPIDSRM